LFNPQLAREGGAAIAREARLRGFNIMPAGGSREDGSGYSGGPKTVRSRSTREGIQGGLWFDYGLFRDRIFEDFESKFLKKNIQGVLTARTFLNPINWFRLSSTAFDRSDLAAEYYDQNVFEPAPCQFRRVPQIFK
jgi:hypothetical protein